MKIFSHILGLTALAVGGVIAIAGGPIAWALLVMVGVPVVLLVLVRPAGHEGPHPHFATPPPRQVPKP